ncbi:MAG: group III truncated hemoglobin [Acidobacteriota bacterium]|nr:group III truncated hemoglobin [Acidobacteriota bacterium]
MKNDIETRADIDDLMNRFYARAINDKTIGYIFTDVVKLDLEHHLPVIGDFWETLLFGTGNYQKHGRNPLQIHAVLHQKSPLTAKHFRRWLELFRETVDESFRGERTEFLKLRAEAIANRILNFVSGVPSVGVS